MKTKGEENSGTRGPGERRGGRASRQHLGCICVGSEAPQPFPHGSGVHLRDTASQSTSAPEVSRLLVITRARKSERGAEMEGVGLLRQHAHCLPGQGQLPHLAVPTPQQEHGSGAGLGGMQSVFHAVLKRF